MANTIKLGTDTLKNFELHNIYSVNGRLQVRWGFQTLSAPTAGAAFIWAFSETFDDLVYHYLFERNTTTGVLTIRCVNENFVTLFSLTFPPVPAEQVFTKAVVEGEILITGPGFNTLFGRVGSGLIIAEKVASLNSATTAIEQPSGICSSFGNRVAIAVGNLLYFSDPSAIRTYVSKNVVGVSGHIYNLIEVTAGLLISTTDGVFILPKDALAQGQEVFGSLQKISPFAASQYQSLVNTPIGPFGVKKELYKIAEVLIPLPLNSYTGRRLNSPRVDQLSFEFSKVYPTPTGFMLTLDGFTLDYNTITQDFTWLSVGSEVLDLVGVCRGGVHPVFVFKDRVTWMREGINFDYGGIAGAQEIEAYLCGSLPGITNEIALTAVTTQANNDGLKQIVYLRGQTSSIKNVIGTDVITFSSPDGSLYSEQELQTCRHRFRVRTIEPQIEVNIQGAGAIIGPVLLQITTPVGTNRGQS